MMEAIILAGGFGTRLRHIVSDVPKPMAPVCARPFLQYILDTLAEQNISRVVLAVGYKWEVIRNYFGSEYRGMQLVYSVEYEPLLTGGAIRKALNECNEEGVFVLNGDTYFEVNLIDMLTLAKKTDADLVLACKHMKNFERYGTVDVDEAGIIRAFEEKQYREEGWINGGIYYLRRDYFRETKEKKFSFEEYTLKQRVLEGKMVAYFSNGYFIDIGIPEDYQKAQTEFQK